MALTPEDVVNKRFQATKFREGYDQDEVDDFLDEVVSELRRLNDENEDLRNNLGACERRLSELRQTSAAAPQSPTQVQAPPQAQTVGSVVMQPQSMAPVAQHQPMLDPRSQLEAAGQAQGPEAAAGMLALAQKLHDEYVRNGEQQRDRIVSEAREHAQRLVGDAEEKQRQTLGSLEQERSLLERKIDELRSFEREYRSRLKSYLEGQLHDLEAKAAVVPSRGNTSSGGGTQTQAATNGYVTNGAASAASISTSGAEIPAVAATYNFGSQN